MRRLTQGGAPISYLINPQAPEAEFHLSYMQAAARVSGQQISVLNASRERDIDDAFATVAQRGGALIVSTDAFYVSRFHQIVELAAFHKIPTIYDRREFVVAGGLISYGTDLRDAYRQIGVCRQDYRGSKAIRSSGQPANQVRAGDQPQDRKGSRPHHSRQHARGRRRSDRMTRRNVAMARSAGSLPRSDTSEVGGEADMPKQLNRRVLTRRGGHAARTIAVCNDVRRKRRGSSRSRLTEELNELLWDARTLGSSRRCRYNCRDLGAIREEGAE